MRIVIDLQGAQSASGQRGIGRYSLNFARALARGNAGHEIIIALNALFPESIPPIRAAFDGLLPAEHVVVWDAPGPVAAIDPANAGRREVAERVREAFIATLNPDIVHISSLFEGFVDDAVTSIGRHGAACRVSATLYDLIPLLNQDQIMKDNPAYAAHYFRKLEDLGRADLLLGISGSAASEATDHLGWDPARIVTVGTGADGRFRRLDIAAETRHTLLERLGLRRPFFMYVSAPDAHKNHRRLIEAFAGLPASLRQAHQLAFIGHFQARDREAFARHAAGSGLAEGELVMTGGLADEDLNTLYNLAKGFVMPSWHEGFGLPAVEAMLCGCATIGSRRASLPEVIGRDDALFDPFDVAEMRLLLHRLATDDEWRADLAAHAIEHARQFTWDRVAERALAAFAATGLAAPPPARARIADAGRRLAVFSPMPPQPSGISDYSMELLPALAGHYDIDVIVEQSSVDRGGLPASIGVRTADWFRAHAHEYDRILYQFGNSPFHDYMIDAIAAHPGMVVLHDFFMCGLFGHRLRFNRQDVARELVGEHGYAAALEVSEAADVRAALRNYPANLQLLQGALGVIVHGEHARQLATGWFGAAGARDFAVIPLLRAPARERERGAARDALGLGPDDLLVCSFGFLDAVKLNDRLLDAWLGSRLGADSHAHLAFVGQNEGGIYGRTLAGRIQASPCRERIRITGWKQRGLYETYLAAADIAVQLRTGSRGETSAAVIDCMNHGIPTIVNAHGTMAELDPSGVWMLADEFRTDELADALIALAGDAGARRGLGERARTIIRTRHAPEICAAQYEQAIEAAYARAERGLGGLIRDLRAMAIPPGEQQLVATALARDFPAHPRSRQLLVDVSTLARTDLRTGIERVARAVLRQWLLHPPAGWRVEPVYATASAAGYRYARQFTCRFLGIETPGIEDGVVEAWSGDVFFGLDFAPDIVVLQQEHLRAWQNRGVKVWFLVNDLLPIQMPLVFPEGVDQGHARWLRTIGRFDGIVCISRSVLNEARSWLAEGDAPSSHRREWVHLGADLMRSAPSRGLPDDAPQVLAKLAEHPAFLMVGTIEPRKGHLQTIAAFDLLWARGVEATLVIVGQEGWKVLPDSQRRTIPRIVETLRAHPEGGRRLFWLDGISDEYLEAIYAASTCLIAASEGEGFGLPLIEAAQHGLPILARDLTVFREVAGDQAIYFSGRAAADLADAIEDWLARARRGEIPDPARIPWITWEDAANMIGRHLGL
ncbi:unnamed protein product [Acidocella sp. C78]|uniref:glycosyltransferase n=1 Tax=Acidocella sp. C78 TaxID=1671486 RepID=UPI00191BC73E|nr:glycosyltransferase [Acidocella sp. C78]CAG4927241.1 unnamed protein product [Acidocella sp. C78]